MGPAFGSCIHACGSLGLAADGLAAEGWTHAVARTDAWIRHNGHMTELALLAEEVGVSERTLRRAVNDGSLRAARPTPRSLQLPLSERRYVRRSWPLISALRAALRTEKNVRFALLFGSAARGTDTTASDVDLLVQMRDPSLERIIDLGAKLSAIVGRRVDIVRLEDAESEPSFLADLVAEGRVLVDREARWARLRRREAVLRQRGRLRDAQAAKDALAGIDRLAPAE
jgi:predicted nucleotidyltransferase